MARYEEHCEDCVRELGEPFGEVHKWLDEFFARLGFCEKHRDVRHHEVGIEEARVKWGDRAAEAARIHIRKDFDGWVPKDTLEVQEWRMGVVHHPE
jgi:hypothetical protein